MGRRLIADVRTILVLQYRLRLDAWVLKMGRAISLCEVQILTRTLYNSRTTEYRSPVDTSVRDVKQNG